MIDEIKNEEEAINTGLESNTFAMLSYLFFLPGALIIYLLNKRDPFVRFSAMQSIIFTAVVIIYYLLQELISELSPETSGIIGVLFSLIPGLIWLLLFLTWIILIYKSYKNTEVSLPLIGRISKRMMR